VPGPGHRGHFLSRTLPPGGIGAARSFAGSPWIVGSAHHARREALYTLGHGRDRHSIRRPDRRAAHHCRPGRRPRGVPPSYSAVLSRASRPLLSDARLVPRRRGPRPGDFLPGMAKPPHLRGQGAVPVMALHHCKERVPEGDGTRSVAGLAPGLRASGRPAAPAGSAGRRHRGARTVSRRASP